MNDYDQPISISGDCLPWSNLQIIIARETLLFQTKTVAIVDIPNFCKNSIGEVFNLLQDFGLGSVILDGTKVVAFKRTEYGQIAYSPTLREKVKNIGLSIHAVLDSLLIAEF